MKKQSVLSLQKKLMSDNGKLRETGGRKATGPKPVPLTKLQQRDPEGSRVTEDKRPIGRLTRTERERSKGFQKTFKGPGGQEKFPQETVNAVSGGAGEEQLSGKGKKQDNAPELSVNRIAQVGAIRFFHFTRERKWNVTHSES